jgi:hypothetical protein
MSLDQIEPIEGRVMPVNTFLLADPAGWWSSARSMRSSAATTSSRTMSSAP